MYLGGRHLMRDPTLGGGSVWVKAWALWQGRVHLVRLWQALNHFWSPWRWDGRVRSTTLQRLTTWLCGKSVKHHAPEADHLTVWELGHSPSGHQTSNLGQLLLSAAGTFHGRHSHHQTENCHHRGGTEPRVGACGGPTRLEMLTNPLPCGRMPCWQPKHQQQKDARTLGWQNVCDIK